MWTIFILAVFLICFYLYFNRDPEREIPEKGTVSPADGKILEIKTITKPGKGYTKFAKGIKMPATMIRIFLSITDVHVQRAPVEGKVKEVRYFAGKNMMASRKDAWQNEHAEITIQNKQMFKIIVIAGLIARRIRTFVKKGQKIQKGQRISRILLGSQVILIIPKCKTKVKKKEKVLAGTSIVA